MEERKTIYEVSERLDVSVSVARELTLLGGGDVELIVECSNASRGLDECKARIIDARFRKEVEK